MPESDEEPKPKNSPWEWPIGILLLALWLSTFLARWAIDNDWHKGFFERYTAFVIGPLLIWSVWTLVRGWLRRRRNA